MRGFFKSIFLGCIVAQFAGCAWGPLAKLERSLLFQPAPASHGNWQPDDLAIENAWFEADDGTELHGWFVPHVAPRATVLFFHGNAGNLTSRAEILRTLHQQHQLSIMTLDYRGFGRSSGQPSERGILQDARAARAWLAARTGIREPDIVLMGRSLGGGVAVDLASQDGAAGLILASTFTSLPDVAAFQLPWVPAHLLMANRLNSEKKISRYPGPLLQSHGDADSVVPYKLGRQLFEAAPGPKKFVTLPGAGHNSPWNEEFHRELEAFLASLSPA